MGYEVERLKKEALTRPVVLRNSSHVVTRYDVNLRDGKPHPRVYVKAYPDIKNIEEEVTFSTLYRLDIGAHAAKSVFIEDKGEVLGAASHDLPNFVEYQKIFSRNQKSIREKVFHCDKFGRPKSIKLTKGLAKILLSAWLYGEDDLHRHNIGIAIDETGEPYWARVDFDMSFSSITQSSRPFRYDTGRYNAITLEGLQQFPELGQYAPFYWPTSVTLKNNAFNFRGKKKGNAYSVADKCYFMGLKPSSDTKASRQFQIDKYEFLCQLFLVDLEDKKQIILTNIADKKHANRLASQIENRILTLQWTALCDPGFQSYVKSLDSTKQKKMIDEVQRHYQLSLSKRIDSSILKKKIDALQRHVDLVKAPPALSTDIAKCVEAIYYLDIEIESLVSTDTVDLTMLNKKRYDLLERQASLLNHYLQAGNTASALNALHFMIYRRSALAPITHIVPKLIHLPKLHYYFRAFRKKRIIPCLKSLKGIGADAIYQHELPERLRHIESLINALINDNELDKIVELLPRITDINENIEVAISEVKQIESILLSYQYKKTLNDPLTRLSTLISYKEPPVLCLSAQYLKEILNVLVSPYLSYCQERRMSPSDIQKSPFFESIFQIQRMLRDILTDELIKTNRGLPCFERDLSRIKLILDKYQLDKLLALKQLDKSDLEKSTKALQEIALVLTRLGLDVQIAQASRVRSLTPLHDQLLMATNELSKALAKPDYHDMYELEAVSYAGYLGAIVLKQPSIGNASRCIEHARQLQNSHQRRMKTKVALSLTVLSLVLVVGAVSMLAWPAGIGVGLSLAAWCMLGIGGGTLYVSGHYGVRRFFRDQDKVKRKLENVGACLLSLDTPPPSPTDYSAVGAVLPTV